MQKHRIRLFTKTVNDHKITPKSYEERFWHIVKDFAGSPRYQWVEDNNVSLEWFEDERYLGLGGFYMLYCDVDDKLYTDYMLRFFDHHDEQWK